MISVYNYSAIGWSLIVYIFHKGIPCGYEVQMSMYFFYFEQKSTFKFVAL